MHREIATELVAPGWSARSRRRALSIVLLAVGLVGPVLLLAYTLLTSRSRLALGLDGGFLGIVLVCGIGALLARLVALAEVWDASGRRTDLERIEILAVVMAVVAMAAGSLAVVQVGRARASLEPAFTGGDVLFDASREITVPSTVATADSQPAESPDEPDVSAPTTTIAIGSDGVPIVIPTVVVTTTTTTLPPLPKRPDSGVDAEQLADVTTVLLLGGDAGPGRRGLRTDTMMLFSLHQPSGRASLISVPRNLRRVLFPPGSELEAQHPYGYDDIANAVYPEVSSRRSLRDAYAVDGIRPGVVAIAQTLGYSLDVTIHDYVLIDMQGFLDLIDAIGGVTVDVSKEIPMPGNVPGAPTQYPDTIGPGVIEMDGTTALGYVRSRYDDNDYRRTDRQRKLLAALARQVSITDLALSFGEVAAAIGGTMRTSLSPDELAATLEVIGGETAIVESVGLVPPLVSVNRPDYDEMAQVVGAVQLALVTGEPARY